MQTADRRLHSDLSSPSAGLDEGRTRSRAWAALALLAVLATAGGLRLAGLGHNSLWVDEGYTAYLTARPIGAYRRELASDTAPPLYYYLTRPVALLAPRNAFALRLPSALLGVASVWLLYVLAVELLGHRPAALASAALLAANRFHVIRCQEARSYSLYLALSLVAMVCLARLARPGSCDRRRRRAGLWVGFVLAAAGMVYTHNIAFFFLAGLLAFYPLARWTAGGAGGPWHRPVAAVAAAGVAVALLYLPWVPVLRAQLAQVLDQYWIAPPTPRGVGADLMALAYSASYPPAGHGGLLTSPERARALGAMFGRLLWLVALVGLTAGAIFRRDRRVAVLAGALAGGVAGLIAYSLIARPVFVTKVAIPFLVVPMLGPAVLIGLCERAGRLRWVGRVTAAVLIAFALLVALADHGSNVHEQWREATGWVLARADPAADALLFDDPHNMMAAEWYLAGSTYRPIRWSSVTPHLLLGGGSFHRADRSMPLNRLPPAEMVAALRQTFGAGRPVSRLWVIQRAYSETLCPPLEAHLRSVARETLRRDFHTVRVRLFEAGRDGPTTQPAG